jgi:two-component system cell cycle response regulator
MKVLIADDDPISRRLLQVSLSQAGDPIVVASDGAEALRLLQQLDGPQLAILDWIMPKVDGVEVCRAIRKMQRERYVYLILLTAKGYQGEIVEGLEAGADDYVTKPYDLGELKARLRVGKRIVELQEQLVTARDCLRVQAMHDSLTGLYNRMAILEALDRELARFTRDGTPLSLIMADLDDFKRINDTHGHPVGDAVLRESARRMRAVIRNYDVIGRHGGEEFLIVAPGCNLAAAEQQAERLRQCVAADPVTIPGGPISVTVSLGVAQATCGLRQAEQLLHAVDQALYSAKKAGRNRVEVFSKTNFAVAPVNP